MSIYADNNATTQPHPFILDKIRGACEIYGNPSSSHLQGKKAKKVLSDARGLIASLIGASPDEVIFTSSATESNNIVLRGVMKNKCPNVPRHIVTSCIEHASIYNTCKDVVNRKCGKGCSITFVGVDNNGVIDLDELKSILRSRKGSISLVSVMGANNVTGTIQPVYEIGKVCRENGVIFHCDMTQLMGKIPIQPKELFIDLMSFSSHKFHGIKGTGGLYVNNDIKDSLHPCITGGGHEFHLRAGTENVPGVIMMALALKHDVSDVEKAFARYKHVRDMRDMIERELKYRIPGCTVNGEGASRLANTCSVCLPNVDSSQMVDLLNSRGVCVSVGSACSNIDGSGGDHVLNAMGVPSFVQSGALRISLSAYNTITECQKIAHSIADSYNEIISVKT